MEKQESREFLELADSYYQEKNYADAITYYKKALNYIQINEEVEQADLFLKMGDLYFDMEDYTTAREYYNNSLNMYSQIKDRIGQGYSLTGLGILQDREGDHDEARKYYNRALQKFQKANDTQRQAVVHSLIASTYESQGVWDDALMDYKRSFQKFEESGNQPHEDFEHVRQDIKEKRTFFRVSRTELVLAVVYILGITTAEIMVAYSNLQVGLTLEAIILFALLVNSSMKTSYNFSILLRSMMALPIIRIIGLSIPLMQIQPLYWFPIISVPLFAASFTIMRSQGLSFKNMGFIWGNIPVQLAIALTGVLLGTIEFVILQPKPLIATLNITNLLFASVILIISTGLAEEMLFRGIIQKNSMNVFGTFYGLLYTSLLFTALHIGWDSLYDLIFVFLVAIFYGYSFLKTKSLLGITLSHGISNTFLFLIVPFYAPLVLGLVPH